MANRIKGITVEIGGDVTKLDKALKSVDTALKTVSGNLRDVERNLKLDPNNVELLALKSELLAEKQELAARRVRVLEEAKKSLDKNLDPKKLQDFNVELAVSKSRAEQAAKAAEDFAPDLDGLAQSAKDAADGMDGASGAADAMGGGFTVAKGVAANLATEGIKLVIDKAAELVEWLYTLDEATEDYREAMGKLNTAYESAGYGPEVAKEAYRGFFEILGETDTATEASQLLSQLATSSEDVTQWVQVAAGVYGTFGDSLPIEGLIEAANETVKTGKVTGQLADALNWVGISEDEVNGNLALMGTELQRAKYLMAILTEEYDSATEAFYRNNETLIQARDAQAEMDEVTGALGETVSQLKTSFFEAFGPLLLESLQLLNGALQGVAGFVRSVGDAMDWLGEKISGVVDWFRELLGLSQDSGGIDIPGGQTPRALPVPADVPGFASGGVFAPNSPFFGVLGDNRTEYEVAAPESMLKETFLEALRSQGGGRPQAVNVNIRFAGSLAQLGRVLQPVVVTETQRQGPRV